MGVASVCSNELIKLNSSLAPTKRRMIIKKLYEEIVVARNDLLGYFMRKAANELTRQRVGIVYQQQHFYKVEVRLTLQVGQIKPIG